MGPTPTWLPVTLVAVAVLAVVVAELRDAAAAVDGPVAYCGLCHVEPTWLVNGLLLVGVLFVLGGYAIGGTWPRSALRGGDDE
jgi:peptidoglycan/LPS O-acetylase OafA/YrhL